MEYPIFYIHFDTTFSALDDAIIAAEDFTEARDSLQEYLFRDTSHERLTDKSQLGFRLRKWGQIQDNSKRDFKANMKGIIYSSYPKNR